MAYQDDLKRYLGEIARYAEPAITAGSAAIAEPVSGLAGLGALLNGRGVGGAVQSINAAQQAMTYQPRTIEGQQGLQGLQAFLQPVGEVIQGASQNLGDKAYSATGSPALAAAAYSAPTALLEGLGLKGLRIARKPVSGADLYSARMSAGPVFSADPLIDSVYAGRKSFIDQSGNFDIDSYNSALYDAEDMIDADTFDRWQNADWQASARALLNESDKSAIQKMVKSKTLYHGSPYDFDEIDVPKGGGAFLTDSAEAASHYADGGNVYKYKINPKKPFFVSRSDSTYDIDQSGELERLIDEGYDAVIPLDGGDYIVLDKSILKREK